MERKWLKIGLLIISALALLGLTAYAGYWYANPQQLIPTPTPTPPAEDEVADWIIYQDEEYAYAVKYPSRWSIKESPLLPRVGYEGFEHLKNIEIYNDKEKIKIRSEVYNNLKGLSAREWARQYAQLGTGASFLKEPESITVDGIQSIKGVHGCCMSYDLKAFLPRGDKIYALGLAEVDFQSYLRGEDIKHEEVFNQILSTFKFLE